MAKKNKNPYRKKSKQPDFHITAFHAKLHRVKVTGAKLHYTHGSITIDPDLLDASGIRVGQQVHINSVENGTHWETYVIPGTRGKGEICLNGPPAHFFKRGHLVVIVAYASLKRSKLKHLETTVVAVDGHNKITKVERN